MIMDDTETDKQQERCQAPARCGPFAVSDLARLLPRERQFSAALLTKRGSQVTQRFSAMASSDVPKGGRARSVSKRSNSSAA